VSQDHERWIGTPQVRAAVRGVLARELVIRVMLHDLRGSLTAVRGWVELLGMDGREVPGGLTRSVAGFQSVVERYSDLAWSGQPQPGQPDLLDLVSLALGVPVDGAAGPGPVDSLRLIAALEVVSPSRVTLHEERVDDLSLRTVRVHGLSPEALQLGLTPHLDQVLPRLDAPDEVLGACLLREVARGGQGEVRSREPGTIDLVCRV